MSLGHFAFGGLSVYVGVIVGKMIHMKRHSSPGFIVFLLLLSVTAFAPSQDFPSPPGGRTLQPITYGTDILLQPNADTSLVCITYRISPAFLTFVRGQSPQGYEQYEARGLVVIELHHTTDGTVLSSTHPIEINRTNPVREGEMSGDLEGMVSFHAAPGTYRLTLEARDQESGRSFTNHEEELTVPAPRARIRFTHPIFAASGPGSDSTFVPLNRGGRVLFGESGGALMEFSVPLAGGIRWKLESDRPDRMYEKQSFSDSTAQVERGIIRPVSVADRPRYSIRSDSLFSTVFIPLPLQRLYPGSFSLSVSADTGGGIAESRTLFDVFWPNRPRSLNDQSLAVEALKHIATPEEMDALTSGSTEQRLARFREFWRKRNPDSTRAFNPVMTEYYRRVDEAVRQYSTRDAMDGYKTDRGRILILFGSPSLVERSLKPGTIPTETWTYHRLRKVFVFSDPDGTGTYVLSHVENQ